MSASAFRATYSDWKLVKTRGVVQVVMEVPLADADKAYEVLGGMPDPSSEQWFGIAALRDQLPKQIEKGKRDWRHLLPQEQAGIRCEEIAFGVFLDEEYPEEWHESMHDTAECVRLLCGVKSRSELTTNSAARTIWHQLDDKYQAWKAMENA